MIDKFKIFNKIKIDTDKYQEVETNDEELKIKILDELKYSKRSIRKRKINNKLITSVASIGIIVIGIGIDCQSLKLCLIK